MTEKTRVRLGAYFLFALLLLALPISLAVTHYQAVQKSTHWVRGDDGLKLVKPTDRAQAISYLQQSRGLSRAAAERALEKRERETGQRIGAPDKVPFGTVIDYYTVSQQGGRDTARLEGSAKVLDAKSPEGQAYVNYVRAQKKDHPEYLDGLARVLKKDTLLVPLGFKQPAPGPVRKNAVLRHKGAASKATITAYRMAVVCTVLPGFRDISPRSDGDTDANDSGTASVNYNTRAASATPAEYCFRQVPGDATAVGKVYNYADTGTLFGATPGTDGAYGSTFGSVFDSPGGVFSTSGTWGVPAGIPAAWDYTQEAMTPSAEHLSNLQLKNAWADLFFSTVYSHASLTNWVYQNTHGHVRVDGTGNDIIGWLTSAHQTNRYPYQIGGGNASFAFPGTPCIRTGLNGTLPPVQDAGYSAATNQIVRATLSDRGLTILFSRPTDFSIGGLTLTAYTNSTVTTGKDGGGTNYTTGTGGSVTMSWSTSISSYTVTMDPYDARRWTITNTGGNGFKYRYYSGTVASPTTNTGTWTPTTGGDWNLAYEGLTNTSGTVLTCPTVDLTGTMTGAYQGQGTTHGAVRQGCPDLYNTWISGDDMLIAMFDRSTLNSDGYAPGSKDKATDFDNRPFARLKSMWYYTHSYGGGTTRQLVHTSNEWNYWDDISGTVARTGGHTNGTDVSDITGSIGYIPRVYPFNSGPNDTWNGGYWKIGVDTSIPGCREGSSSEYARDVDNVLIDNGVDLASYGMKIYIAADGTSGGEGTPETVTSGFQPTSSLENLNEGGAGVIFHEFSHNLGAMDLYDNDLYKNHQVPPPVPTYHECYAMGKYSIMDSGGRMDAFHLVQLGYCTPQAVTRNTLGVQFPEIESMLRDPVVLKIPASPYYLKQMKKPGSTMTADDWQEYFLIENRNVNSGDGNGAYGFDTSTKGLYIYHVDKRNAAVTDSNQAGVPGSLTAGEFQREDDLLTVIIEQADGKHEMEFSNKGATTQNFETDPFGANTASRVDAFWQFPMYSNDTNHLGLAVAGVSDSGSPTSYSHGYTLPEKTGSSLNLLIPGTATDSFSRVINISNIGSTMSADVYVEPAELRVTGTSIAPTSVQQGAEDQGFLKLVMENRQDTTTNLTDMSRMSTAAVYVDTLRILESGTSQDGTNLAAVKLYQDVAPYDGALDPDVDALIATGSVSTAAGQWKDYSVFTDLGFRVPLGETRTLFVAYDIAPEAQNNPHITVGAEFPDASKVLPRTPGTVEVLKRQDANPDADNAVDLYNFGGYTFPIASDTAVIVGYPDRLVITPETTTTSQASQGQTNVAMLKLDCEVNPGSDPRAAGSVRIDSLKVEETGTITAVSELTNCMLYLDDGDGAFSASSDTPLGNSSFTLSGALEVALFQDLNLSISAGTPQTLWLAVSVGGSATVGDQAKLSINFATPTAQPQTDCYVQLINNTTEADANKDYVEYDTSATPPATWPMESAVLTIIAPNQAPYAPIATFSPAGGASISDTTPTLTWSMPDPPDPDASDTLATLHYEIQVADNSSFTSPISGTTTTNVLAWTVPDVSALAVSTDYYWRVRTVDAQDATSAWSASQTFTVVSNRAPNQITSGFAPTGDITTLTPDITWDKTTDPDASDTQDTLRYVLQIDDNSDFSSPLALTNLGAAPAWESYNVPAGSFAALSHADQNTYSVLAGDGLEWGTYYYYRVAAQDSAGTQSVWSTSRRFRPIQDRHPYTPIATFAPADDVEVETANPVISWNMPDPPDPDVTDPLDVLYYKVQLKKAVPEDNDDMTDGTIINFTTTASTADVSPADGIIDSMEWVVTQNAGGAPVNLEDDAHYYYRVRAFDDENKASDWTDVQSFWVNLVNDNPAAPTGGFDPANGEQINDSTPTMTWYAGTDPDHSDDATTLHYVVELSTAADCSTVNYQYTSTDGVASVTPTVALTDLTTWYWRVKTVDNEGAESGWSDIQNFYLDVNNSAPTLTADTVTPMYGPISTFYQLFVTYTDAENDQPGKVYCAFDGGTPQEMAKVVPGDVTATDGIRYVIGVAGTTLGLGVHTYQFTCDAPAAPLSGTGPIIGEASRIWFTDQSGAGIATYEEGQPVYLKVADNDENANPAGLDTVVVTVTETGGDSETVTLTETGVATAVFRGSLPTLGRAGADNNGTLNAIGGPSGNTLTVSYADADETGYAGQDTASTTATLYDTVAPALVAKKLVVTSGPHGRTATLNWAAYDEAAQIDVAGYNVYYSDAAFASTVGLTPYVGLTAGTQTIDVSGLTPNKAYWFAVAPFDEKPNERTTLTPVKLTTRDTSAPVISGESPARGATEVALDSTVSFTLDDAGVGIDRKSLVVNLTQNGAAVARGPLTVTGDKSRMTITATPTADFDWNGVVTVSIDVMDLDGNELVVNDWTFSLVADTEVPTLDTQSPAANATNVPISSSISFHLKDTTSGIDQSSVRVSVNGVNVTSSLSFSGTAADTTVLYDPADDLLYSSTYTVSVTARDVAGNALSPSPATWSFDTVLDSTGVVIDQYDPARSATDVPITTNIGMRLSDPQAGIQVGSFRMWVQNVEVTSDAGLTITQTPATGATATTMLVSYNPSEDLPYSTDIQVRLYVRDGVGNITDLTYKFTTSDAPTYNISGEITQPSGAALAGVTVTAGGKTAVSDGNGAYRITGLLAGTYVVTPTRDEYVFTPENQTVVLGGTNDDAGDVDFQGELQTYSVSGTVKLGKTALGGVSVTCNGQTVVTAANGTYTISGLANGQYTVTPALANYHFQPTSRAAQVAGASVTGVDFAAIADTFTIAGTVYDNSGNRLQGVTVTTGSKTAVTNAAGQYIVTGLVANTYTLAATKTGYAFSPTTQDVTVPASATGVDFTAYVNMSTTFPGGFNLIGIPGTPADSDPTKVFLQSDGTPVVQCYRWNPDATPPQYLVAINDGSAAAMQVKPGRGYFVRFNESTALNVAGTPTNATKSTSIGLSEGWNMIANPTSSPLKWSKFVPTVEDGIRPFAFVYDTVSGSYKMVSDEAAVNADRDTLLGWEGAWVRALSSGVSLTVTGTTTTAAEPVCKPAQASLNGGWVIPVVAKAGRRADYTSVAGVVPGSAGSYTIENPPTAPATVDVYFTDTAGTRLAHDIRTEDGAQTFNFVVSCAVADTQVAVTLPDLSKVPANMQVTLVDEETGKSTYARTMQSYTYQSKGDSSARKFRLVVSPRTTSALAVTAAAASTRGQGVMVTYNVTKACQVSIRVLNLAGRTVKTLAAGQTVTAGVQSQLWNLSSENGTTVPAGTYLLQIDAATDDGQQVRGLTQVRVAR